MGPSRTRPKVGDFRSILRRGRDEGRTVNKGIEANAIPVFYGADSQSVPCTRLPGAYPSPYIFPRSAVQVFGHSRKKKCLDLAQGPVRGRIPERHRGGGLGCGEA